MLYNDKLEQFSARAFCRLPAIDVGSGCARFGYSNRWSGKIQEMKEDWNK